MGWNWNQTWINRPKLIEKSKGHSAKEKILLPKASKISSFNLALLVQSTRSGGFK